MSVRYRTPLFMALIVVLFSGGRIAAQQHEHQHGDVDFSVSCNQQAQVHVQTGVAQLHHIT